MPKFPTFQSYSSAGERETHRLNGQSEQMIARAVSALGVNAYGAAIQRHIRSLTNRNVSLGQIATTLERLEAKGLLSSTLSASEPVRGGRAKRIFKLEDRGVQALENAVTSHAMIFGADRKASEHGKSTSEPKPTTE